MKIPSDHRAAWCFIAYVAIIALVALPGFMFSNISFKLQKGAPLHAAIDAAPQPPATLGGMPIVLSERDGAHYKDAFLAQRRQDWPAADAALARVTNPVIMGHVLAERYLHRSYDSSKEELEGWLARYRYLPEAFDIYQLAERKFDIKEAPVDKPDVINLRGDDNGLAANFDETKHYKTWRSAIDAFHAQKYARAAELFDKMLDDRKELSPWKISAAGFWSWRSHMMTGEREKGFAALRLAATEPRSFYGILARRHLGQPLEVNRSDLQLSVEEIESLGQYSTINRAVALAQVDRNDLAERELIGIYKNLPRPDRHAMLRLAHQLSLPALQITLAKRLETDGERLDLAKYPIPEWEPVGGFSVDPALIYALVRQESGFKSGAISPAGAMGLMQLMPSTASMMSSKMGPTLTPDASEAERNITLGQSYVRHLLENQLVNNNMIFMLTAYNAGIGRLQEWKNSIDYQGDPLLFIERMPYAETRHYVMQVMTNYWLYNEILGIKSPTLASLAKNEWPVYVRTG